MLFNSYIFWIFYGIVLLLYRALPHVKQNRMLLLASWFFYGYWDWRFLALMILSTTIDYFAARAIEATEDFRRRKLFLLVSLSSNLTILGVFKYSGFFVRELNHLLAAIGLPHSMPVLEVVLPVGISFYTFQSMAYAIDVYRREVPATKNYLDFALFVAFFPHLVAGPIQRASSLIPQLLNPRIHRESDFQDGLYLVVSGLFKKVAIADNLAGIANGIFSADPLKLTGSECLVGVYAFAIQIYCDFSGYSQIAQGIAKWMGFDLVTNFKMPYFAISPSDFWNRWHISLSTWLRDYLYIPLGGNRCGTWKTYRNLMLTMALGGLWHGANWTYIVWGAFHGVLLCGWRIFEKPRHGPQRLSPLSFGLRAFVMFQLVCLSWLFFRAQSMHQVNVMLVRMFTHFSVTPFAISMATAIAFYTVPLLLFEYLLEKKHDLLWMAGRPAPVQGLAYAYCFAMLILFAPEGPHEFIYFQF